MTTKSILPSPDVSGARRAGETMEETTRVLATNQAWTAANSGPAVTLAELSSK